MKTGVELIAEERLRQINEEGWTPEHDDTHSNFELSRAAIAYIASALTIRVYQRIKHADFPYESITYEDLWPWSKKLDWRSQFYSIRTLTIAGALIAAEIDRLQRKKEKNG